MRTELKLTLFTLTALTLPAFTSFSLEPNSVELEIAQLTDDHPQQARTEFIYDPILHFVARQRAKTLAKSGRDLFEEVNQSIDPHIDTDGYGPNRAVQLAGYGLPAYWGSEPDTNYIEVLAWGGNGSTNSIFNAWVNSAWHRPQVLGEGFYQNQARYGIGYFYKKKSPHKHYYVFISAPVNQNGDLTPLEPFNEWLFKNLSLKEIDTEPTNCKGLPRVFEFLLNYDPDNPQELPMPMQSTATNTSSWTLPLRSTGIGSISYEVQYKAGFTDDWSTNGITKDGDTYSTTLGNSGFWQLMVNPL